MNLAIPFTSRQTMLRVDSAAFPFVLSELT